MRVTVLQPSYLPWLGYFDQMARADRFVYLDDVQFTRRDWRNRNKIRTQTGWCWLTVPVQQKNRYNQSLRETLIDNQVGWARKHREAIRFNYSRTPYFDVHFPYFESIYNKDWVFLMDLCMETLQYLKSALHIDTPILLASEMDAEGEKADRILSLCKKMNATRYLSGDQAKDYLSEERFEAQGVILEYQDYRHPVYPQRFPNFIPYLSVVDLLFNVGEESLQVLMQGTAPSNDLGQQPAGTL